MGASPYGSYGTGYSSPYGGSPYSRLGGYGGYGGAMGGMGSMYGGGYGGMYGGGMGGMGGMYGGMGGGMGMPGDPNNPDSLTNRFSMNTQATFQMLEGIVGAFGGFAQMLESTYMATHSSFFGKFEPLETRTTPRGDVFSCTNHTQQPWLPSPSNSATYEIHSAPCSVSSP